MGRIYNFSAGPSMLAEDVLTRAAAELLDYRGTGMSVMEMSHRSKAYEEIISHTEELFRRVMNIPSNYKVLFLQGGATLQFACVPLNLLPRTGSADYVLSGNFSTKAYEEAARIAAAQGKTINIAGSTKGEKFSRVPRQDELRLNKNAAYCHICYNNTIYGSVYNYIPDTGNVPLAADVSSCILSAPLDVSRFGVLYAGAQKNIAPAGLTVVIIREDLLEGEPLPGTPALCNYRVMAEHESMYNTPPCYGIYMAMLTLEWLEKNGSLAEMGKRNREKAALLYDYLDSTDFYKTSVVKENRSMMNVTFRTEDEETDAEFVSRAAKAGLVSLKGHRAAGGMRASIYNAMPRAGVEALVSFMKDFENEKRRR